MNRISELLGQVPEWADLVLTIDRLEGGLTNQNYKVTLPEGQAYVARLPGNKTELLGINRDAEVIATRRAGELGIGPAVFGELPTVGTLLMAFVPGHHATFTAARLRSVARAVARFHASGDMEHRFPIFRIVDRHALDVARLGVVPPAEYYAMREPAERIEAALAGEAPVPCHNDLLPANVLFTNDDAMLIDFEYAGMNHAFFDLGNLSVNADLTPALDEVLLEEYFSGREVTDHDRARLQLMKVMSEFREGMWAVVQETLGTNTAADYRAYADQRLGNALRLAGDPRFEGWLAVARSSSEAVDAQLEPQAAQVAPIQGTDQATDAPKFDSGDEIDEIDEAKEANGLIDSPELEVSEPHLFDDLGDLGHSPSDRSDASAEVDPDGDGDAVSSGENEAESVASVGFPSESKPEDRTVNHPSLRERPADEQLVAPPYGAGRRRGRFWPGLVVGLVLGGIGVAAVNNARRTDGAIASATVTTATAVTTTAKLTTSAVKQASSTSVASKPIATAATASAQAPTTPPPATWVMGNYPWYERTEVTPAAFPYRKLTHVSIGNLYLSSPTECCKAPQNDTTIQWTAFERDVIQRAHASGTKILAQIGGEGGNPNDVWNKATGTAAAATHMAGRMAAYAKGRGYDGIEIDWEENLNTDSLAMLVTALRETWPDAVISVDVASLVADWAGWAPLVAESADRINIMTYVVIQDWGGWDGPWHLGAVYENADGSRHKEHPSSVDRAVQGILAAGVPPGKVGIGLGLYGAGYGDTNGDGECPTSPEGWAGETKPIIVDHALTLAEIDHRYLPVMKRTWDSVSQTPWLSAPAPGAGGDGKNIPDLCYITYEDAQSAAAKARYINKHDLGGIILWATPQDVRPDGSYPTIDALNAGLAGKK